MSHSKGVVFGTNGTAQVPFENCGSLLLALFVKLNRGCNQAEIQQDIDTIIAHAPSSAELVDLFVLVFQTRDCRGGKGERDLFRTMFLTLYKHFPEETIGLLSLIPRYGYFKDFEALYVAIASRPDAAAFAPLSTAIVNIFADSLRQDHTRFVSAVEQQTNPEFITLAAKYAPRKPNKKNSASHKATFFHAVRNATVSQDGKIPHNASQVYRKILSGLNEHLQTVEKLMSANRWDEIEVKRIPAICMKRSRNAFLFEDKQGKIRDDANEARIALRRKLLAPKAQKEIKGGQLFANTLVKECMGRGLSEAQVTVINAQWNDIVRTVQKEIKEFAEQQQAKGAEPAIDLGNLVPLVDVSGSMSGTPMEVAVAMGLIVSELTAPAFRGRVLTFESAPRWHQIQGSNIQEKVSNLMNAPWGGSTNFRAAMLKIVEALEQIALSTRQMPPIPELIVFSDMQFDQAGASPWDTAFQTIQQDFKRLGQRLKKAGVVIEGDLEPPVITFWNIAARTTGLVAGATQPGVRQISGFSQSLLKLVLSGALPEAVDEKKVNALETLYTALQDHRYDEVRVFFDKRTTGKFQDFEFELEEVEETTTTTTTTSSSSSSTAVAPDLPPPAKK